MAGTVGAVVYLGLEGTVGLVGLAFSGKRRVVLEQHL